MLEHINTSSADCTMPSLQKSFLQTYVVHLDQTVSVSEFQIWILWTDLIQFYEKLLQFLAGIN